MRILAFLFSKMQKVSSSGHYWYIPLFRARFDMMSNGKPCSPNEVSS